MPLATLSDMAYLVTSCSLSFFLCLGKDGKVGVLHTSTDGRVCKHAGVFSYLTEKTILPPAPGPVLCLFSLEQPYSQVKLGFLFCGTHVGLLSASTTYACQVLGEIISSIHTAGWLLIL